jgi:hypothetical protein
MEQVNTAAVTAMIDTTISDIRSAIDSAPGIHSQSSAGPVLQWADQVFEKILSGLESLLPMIDHRLQQLESLPLLTQPSTTPAARFPAAALTASTSHPGRSPRCTNCHARGHAASACSTANPSAMRKRVAANARAARDARQRPFTAPFAPLLLPQAASLTTTPAPLEYAALAADAAELRRRTAQSRRDRRLKRNPTSS